MTKPVTYTFTEAEARLLNAIVVGECNPDRFIEGGDYQSNWARDCEITDLDAFLLKLARLPSHRSA